MTQTLVVFVIRSVRTSSESLPSRGLVLTTVSVVVLGLLLPFSFLAAPMGFVALPGGYFVFLGIATGTYLVMVEFLKRRLMSRVFIKSFTDAPKKQL